MAHVSSDVTIQPVQSMWPSLGPAAEAGSTQTATTELYSFSTSGRSGFFVFKGFPWERTYWVHIGAVVQHSIMGKKGSAVQSNSWDDTGQTSSSLFFNLIFTLAVFLFSPSLLVFTASHYVNLYYVLSLLWLTMCVVYTSVGWKACWLWVTFSMSTISCKFGMYLLSCNLQTTSISYKG